MNHCGALRTTTAHSLLQQCESLTRLLLFEKKKHLEGNLHGCSQSEFHWVKTPLKTSNESNSCCYYACVFMSKCFQLGREGFFFASFIYLKSWLRVTRVFFGMKCSCSGVFDALRLLVCSPPTKQNVLYCNPACLLLKSFCCLCVSCRCLRCSSTGGAEIMSQKVNVSFSCVIWFVVGRRLISAKRHNCMFCSFADTRGRIVSD